MPNKKQIVLIINVNNCCDSYAITFPQKDAVGKNHLFIIFCLLYNSTGIVYSVFADWLRVPNIRTVID